MPLRKEVTLGAGRGFQQRHCPLPEASAYGSEGLQLSPSQSQSQSNQVLLAFLATVLGAIATDALDNESVRGDAKTV